MDSEPTNPAPSAPPETEEPIRRQGHTITPQHVNCPAVPLDQPKPAMFYYRREGINEKGESDQIWVCESCGMAVTLALHRVEVTATLGEVQAKVMAVLSRPEAELGPEAVVYDPHQHAYLIQSTGRYINKIGCEIGAEPPNPEKPLTTYGISKSGGLTLSLRERLAVAAFMTGRWFAWARSPEHDNVIRAPRPGDRRFFGPN